jgi:hypothetical protein
MSSLFKKELKTLAETVIYNSERELRSNLKKAYQGLGKVLLKKKNLTPNIVKSLEAVINEAIAHNCAFFIRESLRSWSGGVLGDFSIPNSHNKQDELIERIQKDHKTGYVYVAWKNKPHKYFYVGKAGTGKSGEVKRISRAHGKLMSAWNRGCASRISLVNPSKSTNPLLFNLETSIIRTYEHFKGETPKFNQASVSLGIPDGPYTDYLNLINDTFTSASGAIERHSEKQQLRRKKLHAQRGKLNETPNDQSDKDEKNPENEHLEPAKSTSSNNPLQALKEIKTAFF